MAQALYKLGMKCGARGVRVSPNTYAHLLNALVRFLQLELGEGTARLHREMAMASKKIITDYASRSFTHRKIGDYALRILSIVGTDLSFKRSIKYHFGLDLEVPARMPGHHIKQYSLMTILNWLAERGRLETMIAVFETFAVSPSDQTNWRPFTQMPVPQKKLRLAQHAPIPELRRDGTMSKHVARLSARNSDLQGPFYDFRIVNNDMFNVLIRTAALQNPPNTILAQHYMFEAHRAAVQAAGQLRAAILGRSARGDGPFDRKLFAPRLRINATMLSWARKSIRHPSKHPARVRQLDALAKVAARAAHMNRVELAWFQVIGERCGLRLEAPNRRPSRGQLHFATHCAILKRAHEQQAKAAAKLTAAARVARNARIYRYVFNYRVLAAARARRRLAVPDEAKRIVLRNNLLHWLERRTWLRRQRTYAQHSVPKTKQEQFLRRTSDRTVWRPPPPRLRHESLQVRQWRARRRRHTRRGRRIKLRRWARRRRQIELQQGQRI